VKSKFIFGFCWLFSLFLQAQEKQDTVLNFYDFKPELNDYQPDFTLKIQRDSTLYWALDSLKNIGYYTLSLDSVKTPNVYYRKGKMYKRIWVKNDSVFNQKQDFFPVKNLDSLIQNVYGYYSERGHPFTEVSIQPIGLQEGEIRIELKTKLFGSRTVDGVKVNGYEKLSKGYIQHGLGIKKGAVYNEAELRKISERMRTNPFVEEARPPQTLFNTDSTTIYLYANKVKSNFFDGILGFGNDKEGKFSLNGNVKIELNNNFNGMESIKLNWIATADESTSLDLNVQVPYLLNTAVGTETQLNIFKRDSTYVNTKIEERLFYQITINSNLGLNLSYENSNFVQGKYPELAAMYDDYSKTGYGLSYQLFQPALNPLMEGKTRIFMIGKTLNRKNSEKNPDSGEFTDIKTNQYEIGLNTYYIFGWNEKHFLKTRLEAYGLFGKAEFFTQNELYRIGGFNSVRGFNEESISASTYGIAGLEYRFLPNDGFYISVFGDYAVLENKPADIRENLLGVGAGISFLTKLGVFNLSYAVGKQSNTGLDFDNSKIHFGLLAQF